MPARVLVDLHVVISKAALLVGQCAIDQLFELFNAERFQAKNLRPRDERAVYIKKRIVSGRTDEAEISSFDIGQKNVLLRFVEMMDLVDKQDCPLARCLETIV